MSGSTKSARDYGGGVGDRCIRVQAAGRTMPSVVKFLGPPTAGHTALDMLPKAHGCARGRH